MPQAVDGTAMRDSAAVQPTMRNTLTGPRRSARFIQHFTPDIMRTIPYTPESATPKTPKILRWSDSVDTPVPAPPPTRRWKDETQSFNMEEVVNSMRRGGKTLEQLPCSYNWFPGAVPIDALFPPGIPISVKEILAFYPHHVRWEGVLDRLDKNDYCASDVLAIQSWFRASSPDITAAELDHIFLDTLCRTSPRPDKIVGAYNGNPDRTFHTGHLRPGRQIEQLRAGLVVPTFNDLLKGLVYLPAGLYDRQLTQCLAWYLDMRDLFKPPLELTVLHTQSLVRALRLPIVKYGQQNIDKIALEDWKRDGQFKKRKVVYKAHQHERQPRKEEGLHRSRIVFNANNEIETVHLTLPVRHVFTFPMMAMIGMAAKGIELGVNKAEHRKAARKKTEIAKNRALAAGKSSKNPSAVTGHLVKRRRDVTPSYRILKRPRL